MHIAGMATFEVGSLKTSDGGIDIDRIRDYVASRLHLIPRYRQRLAHVPMEHHPVWVDDEHFNPKTSFRGGLAKRIVLIPVQGRRVPQL